MTPTPASTNEQNGSGLGTFCAVVGLVLVVLPCLSVPMTYCEYRSSWTCKCGKCHGSETTIHVTNSWCCEEDCVLVKVQKPASQCVIECWHPHEVVQETTDSIMVCLKDVPARSSVDVTVKCRASTQIPAPYVLTVSNSAGSGKYDTENTRIYGHSDYSVALSQ